MIRDISAQELDNLRLAAIEAYRKLGDVKSIQEADKLMKTHNEQVLLRAEQAKAIKEHSSYVAPYSEEPCVFKFHNKTKYSCDICDRQELEHLKRR